MPLVLHTRITSFSEFTSLSRIKVDGFTILPPGAFRCRGGLEAVEDSSWCPCKIMGSLNRVKLGMLYRLVQLFLQKFCNVELLSPKAL